MNIANIYKQQTFTVRTGHLLYKLDEIHFMPVTN